MSRTLRTMGYKWLSSLIVCSLILQIVPVSGLATVFAEENSTEQVKNEPKEQVSKNARQEIVSKRTENSKTFLNNDGTLTAEISQNIYMMKSLVNPFIILIHLICTILTYQKAFSQLVK